MTTIVHVGCVTYKLSYRRMVDVLYHHFNLLNWDTLIPHLDGKGWDEEEIESSKCSAFLLKEYLKPLDCFIISDEEIELIRLENKHVFDYYISTNEKEYTGNFYKHKNYWSSLMYYDIEKSESELLEYMSTDTAYQSFCEEMVIKSIDQLVS